MKVFSDLSNDEDSFTQDIRDEVILPSEAMEKMQDKEFLNSLIDELPENYKQVLTLYYQEEMTFAEIGETLEKPLNTVKSWHRRALIKLRELM
jgi:RNA polymerase sigma-70 factor (ECF subfamily)